MVALWDAPFVSACVSVKLPNKFERAFETETRVGQVCKVHLQLNAMGSIPDIVEMFHTLAGCLKDKGNAYR